MTKDKRFWNAGLRSYDASVLMQPVFPGFTKLVDEIPFFPRRGIVELSAEKMTKIPRGAIIEYRRGTELVDRWRVWRRDFKRSKLHVIELEDDAQT